MTDSEFGSLMEELNIVYGDKRFSLKKDILDVWNKHLSKFEFSLVERAVDEFVQEPAYAPTVADIIGPVKEYERERKKVIKECQEMVEFTMDLYPGGKNRSKVMELTGKLTGWDKPKVAKLCARIRMFIKEIETSAKSGKIVAFLPLDELLEGWSNESGS